MTPPAAIICAFIVFFECSKYESVTNVLLELWVSIR